jgi:hypothetical protein
MARSDDSAARPSTITASSAFSVAMTQCEFAARFFALRVLRPVLNQNASLHQMPQTIMRWERPSGLDVATHPLILKYKNYWVRP